MCPSQGNRIGQDVLICGLPALDIKTHAMHFADHILCCSCLSFLQEHVHKVGRSYCLSRSDDCFHHEASHHAPISHEISPQCLLMCAAGGTRVRCASAHGHCTSGQCSLHFVSDLSCPVVRPMPLTVYKLARAFVCVRAIGACSYCNARLRCF